MTISIKKFTSIFLGNLSGVLAGFIIASVLISRSGMYSYGFYVTIIAIFTTVSVFFKPLTWISVLKYSDKHSLGMASLISIILEFGNVVILYLSLCILKFSIDLDDKYINFVLTNKEIVCLYVFFVNSGFSLGVSRYNEKYNVIAFVMFLTSISKVLLAVYFSKDVEELVYYTIIADIVLWCSLFVFSLLNVKFSVGVINGFAKTAYTANFINIVDLPVNQLDRVIVTAIAGEEVSAVFSLIRRLSMLVNQVSDPIYQMYYKEFSREGFVLDKSVFKNTFFNVLQKLWIVIFVGLLLYPIVIGNIDSIFFDNQLKDVYSVLYCFILIYSFCCFFVWINPLFYLHISQIWSVYITIISNVLYTISLILVFTFSSISFAFIPLLLQCMSNYLLKIFIANKRIGSDI